MGVAACSLIREDGMGRSDSSRGPGFSSVVTAAQKAVGAQKYGAGLEPLLIESRRLLWLIPGLLISSVETQSSGWWQVLLSLSVTSPELKSWANLIR